MRCSRRKVRRARPLLGTFVSVDLRGRASRERLDALAGSAFAAVERVERLMSAHRPDSELARLNRAPAGRWVELDAWTLEVLAAANGLFERSGGAFDPRRGALGARQAARPPVELEAGRARKTGPWRLDLGGLAKGYAVDRAVARLRRAGRSLELSGVVNAGGDLRVFGPEAARVAVLVEGREGSTSRALTLRDAATATSAARRPGRAGAPLSPAVHVRRPSGRPLRAAATACVAARRCMEADALAKVALLAPARRARACLASYRARGWVFDVDGALRRELAA